MNIFQKTHVFAVAIENYQDSKVPPVIYAENDAKAFISAWQALGVDPANCVLLLSSQATLAAFKSRLKKFLHHITSSDHVIFFYAGHGVAFSDVSYVTAYDTQRGDVKATSFSVGDLLKQLRDAQSDKLMLFLDSCHSGFPIAANMRSIYSQFSADELIEFCKDAEFSIAFASCKVDESSFSNRKLKHGIWTFSVLEALDGKAKEALEQGRVITSRSLQGYLKKSVPRLLKTTITGTETQTPCMFGNQTEEFVVADLTNFLRDRATAASASSNFIKDAALVQEIHGNVSRLSGYYKPVYPLKSHNRWEQNFVEKAGESEVKQKATEIHDAVRDAFKYKRRDLVFTIDKGSASIKTPDFDVDISLAQDPGSADEYIFKTEVTSFRRPDIISDIDFIRIFSRHCDSIVFDLSTSINIEDKIDEIEDIPSLASGLSYKADCSEFTLRIPGLDVTLSATPNRLTFSLRAGSDLKALLDGTRNAIVQLGGSNITLSLPSGSP